MSVSPSIIYQYSRHRTINQPLNRRVARNEAMTYFEIHWFQAKHIFVWSLLFPLSLDYLWICFPNASKPTNPNYRPFQQSGSDFVVIQKRKLHQGRKIQHFPVPQAVKLLLEEKICFNIFVDVGMEGRSFLGGQVWTWLCSTQVVETCVSVTNHGSEWIKIMFNVPRRSNELLYNVFLRVNSELEYNRVTTKTNF